MTEQIIQDVEGVPDFTLSVYRKKKSNYALLIPVINENGRITAQLARLQKARVPEIADIIICDGGSTDGSMAPEILKRAEVRALLTKTGPGKQGAQLRTGLYWALQEGYTGVITVDGNNKDSVENVPRFVHKLEEGYDFVQGSRFVKGGLAVRTPPVRLLALKLVHAPVTSLAAHHRFTDSTNGFRAYSRRYLTHPKVKPLRDVFSGYELLAYLSTRATQLGLSACEVPVARVYPKGKGVPTKIKGWQANKELLRILFDNALGKYNP